MKGMLYLLVSAVGGAVGWWLGEFVGLMTAVLLSAVGSGAGIFLARWMIDRFLD